MVTSGNRVTVDEIRERVRLSGLSGVALCVHSSLRSFGHVAGGSAAIVGALLDEGCTVLVPTFSSAFAVPPPSTMRPPRNGWNYDRTESEPASELIYTPATRELDRQGMGAIPAAVLAMEDSIRGNHPLNSCTAIGPQAKVLISAQQPWHVYAPLEALADLGGYVVLMGVDLTSMTILHLAEQMAGRSLFRRWANDATGRPMMAEVGSCSDGFNNFAPILAPIEQQVHVGQSLWRIFPARSVLARAVPAIQTEPSITHCADPWCARCNDAVQGGPILTPS